MFHDNDRNFRLDLGEKGLQNIKVLNGGDIVITDDSGKYRIVDDDRKINFLSEPFVL